MRELVAEATGGAMKDSGRAEPARWTVREVRDRIDRGQVPVFVDTRNPTAWAESDVKVPGAIRIPLDELEARADSIPKGRPVVTYCT